MLNIMLSCCMGASTSIVAAKMRKEAEKQGKEVNIWAVDTDEIPAEMGKADVILLGPQVRHMLKKIEGTVNGAVPVAVISPVDYGRCNAPAILAMAEKLVEKK